MSQVRQRRHSGAAISEFGPVVFILVVLTLFPMVNLLYIGAGYAAAWYLNFLEIRELSVRKPDDAQSALADVDKAWLDSGLARFLHVSAADVQHTGPTYDPSPTDPADKFGFVNLSTSVTIQPFLRLPLPLIGGVPGVGAPFKMDYVTKRVQEEKGLD